MENLYLYLLLEATLKKTELFTASWGFQAGAESYGYIVFLMNEKALDYIHKSHGWEIGTGPTVVVVNEGIGLYYQGGKPSKRVGN